jgi:hypothetical protein
VVVWRSESCHKEAVYELEIKMLHNAPRDADKLEQLLQAKERAKEESTYIEDTERIATEIEMLKVVFYLANRNSCSSGST